jgi:DNA-binding IclR family transcriptional regulator
MGLVFGSPPPDPRSPMETASLRPSSTDKPGRPSGQAQPADDTNKSIAKVIRILECFSTTHRSLSVAEISERSGYPRSTAHRLCASLREGGLLDQGRQRDRYRLGLKLFQFGNIALSNMDLHREARPHIEQLGRLTGQLVHLAVFDGHQAIVIHRSDPTASPTPLTFIETAPIHCTSVGKAILAFQPPETVDKLIGDGLTRYTDTTITDEDALKADLAAIHARGYSLDEGEHQPGLRCIGAPVHDHDGRVFAAISISGPAWKMPAAETDNLAQIVKYTANQISAAL